MLFIDSSNIEEIDRFYDMGIVNGVTCNPTILKKDGIMDIPGTIMNICDLVAPDPVSVEVTVKEPEQIVGNAEEIATWTKHGNIVIKVPIHGPEGENYLKPIYALSRLGIAVNVTACMSAMQGYLGALAGAHYVSLFCGRIADLGHDVENELYRLHRLLIEEQFKTGIIAGSVREASNVLDWINWGAHIVTVTPEILDKLIIHARTKETVQEFLANA